MTEETKRCVEVLRGIATNKLHTCHVYMYNNMLKAADLIESLFDQLEQTENKLSELLSHATGGRFSKAGYSIDDMRRFVDDYNQSTCDKCDELEQVTRERDAAVEDILRECHKCKHFKVMFNGCTPDYDCEYSDVCEDGDRWQWRGVEANQ